MTPARNPAVQPIKVSSSGMGRREFLQVMSVVSVASFLALVNASKSLTNPSITNTTETDTGDTTITETDAGTTHANKPGCCGKHIIIGIQQYQQLYDEMQKGEALLLPRRLPQLRGYKYQ